MTLSDVSIERPILTWMMTLALIVFGVLGYNRLGVDQFPNMEFPVVVVTSTLEGATPEGIEEDVTDVLEESLNTIAGVRTIMSTSYRGASQIVVEFELGTDLDVVTQDVRDMVARARFELPSQLQPPVVGTFNPNDQPVLWSTSKKSPGSGKNIPTSLRRASGGSRLRPRKAATTSPPWRSWECSKAYGRGTPRVES